jgi:hypothetical protein
LHSTQQPLAVHDAAIKWLAGNSHPQQRRQLLNSHKRKFNEFIEDSNAQWDSESYVVNRYSRTRTLGTLFATAEMKQNIEATTLEDGRDIPLNRNGATEDKLSINELQLQLSNQAAVLRMTMANEYEDMRIFQNKELETLLKAKAKKEPEFQKLVEEARVLGSRPQPNRPQVKLPSRRDSASTVTQSPTVQISQSPIVAHPPDTTLDLNKLKTDASLPEFVRFFLHLQVVQQNWPVISRNWPHYVFMFQRNLLPQSAFARAILEDAVNSNGNTKFTVEPEHIQKTREAAQKLPEKMHMSRLITEVILEMAEAGAIDFTSNDSLGETLGPKIVVDVMKVEKKFAVSR